MYRTARVILGMIAVVVGVLATAGPTAAEPATATPVLVVDAEGKPIDGAAVLGNRGNGDAGTLALPIGTTFDAYYHGVLVHFANAHQWLDQGKVWAFGNARLAMQTDGNLVIYHRVTGFARWTSNTRGSGAVQMLFQPDGNLVLYTEPDGRGTDKWSSATYDRCSAPEVPLLGLQADSNFVIYCGFVNLVGYLFARPIWATNTVM